MMRNKIYKAVLSLVLGAGVMSSYAQQDPLFTQYRFNSLALNPAFAGHEGVLSAVAQARLQWVSFEGAPKTQVLSLHAPLKNENLGWGLTVMRDEIGPVQQTGFWGNVSYEVKLTQNADLRFGLRLGGALHQVGLSDLDVVDNGDVAFSQNTSKFLPNVGFGMIYEAEKYHVGLSLPRLMRNDLDTRDDYGFQEERRHFFLNGGYKHAIKDGLILEPAFMLRKVKNAPLSLDLGAYLEWQDALRLGAFYRLGDAIAVMAQYPVTDQFYIGYAYDLTTSGLGQYNAGTHELLLRFDLKKKKQENEAPDAEIEEEEQ